jgi:hypothetical protein
VDVEHPNRLGGAVRKPVANAGRDEHEGPRPGGDRALLEVERELALENQEGVVLLVVDVRLEHPPSDDLDDPDVEARCIRGPGEELDVAETVALAGRDDDRSRAHGAVSEP